MTKKNKVLVFEEKGEFFTTSLDVAEKFKKRNVDVLRAIENLNQIAILDKCNIAHMFELIPYKDSAGRGQKAYNITRDGFSLLVMGFTGSGVMEWKLKYIEAFNKLEKYVRAIQHQEFKNRTNPDVVLLREENRISNKDFNAALKEFVEYAEKDETSRSPKRYYMVFNNMINHALFTFPKKLKNIPDKLSGAQLKFADSTKQAISDEIQKGIESNLYYKDIFQNCKKRAFLIAEGLGVTPIPLMLE